MKLILAFTGRTYDQEPIVALDIDGQRYWFNLPQNTFRFDCTAAFKLRTMRHLFVTSMSPRAFGGYMLVPMALGDASINITGPQELTKLFTPDHWLVSRYCISPDYEDESIVVRKIELHKTVAFDVRFRDKPGKFLPAVATQLGCPKGPLFKQLASGQNVVLEDGTVIEASKCRDADVPGERILVVNCECDEDVDALPSDLPDYNVVVHLTDMKIANTEKYLAKFKKSSKHVCFPMSGKVVYDRHGARYEAIRKQTNVMSILSCDQNHEPYPEHFVAMDSGVQFLVDRPRKAEQLLEPPMQILEQAICPLPEFKTFAVTLLGTGGGIPSPERSLTAFLIHTRSGYVLLDAGEGVAGQIYRKYGLANGDHVLRNLKCLWISHLDADHVCGMTDLLTRRASLSTDTLVVCCNQKTSHFIESHQCFHDDYHIRIVVIQEQPNLSLDGIVIDSFPVVHRSDSYGCRITIDDTWKVAYSGDRAASKDNFHALVGDVDCLIHEATFEAFKEDEDDIQHSTFAEAVEAGNLMHAKVTVLTHLSRRYQEFIDTHSPTSFMGIDLLDFAFEDMNPDSIADLTRADCLSY